MHGNQFFVNGRLRKQNVAKKASASKKARHFIASLKGRGIRLRGFFKPLAPFRGQKMPLAFFPADAFFVYPRF